MIMTGSGIISSNSLRSVSNEVTVYLEDIRPSELGRVCDDDLGVVGRLLVRYCE